MIESGIEKESAETRGGGAEGVARAGAMKPEMKLDQFLKWCGIAATGGQAKVMIQGGDVRVNGVVETRRGRKLRRGDRVEAGGRLLTVDLP